MPIVLSRSFNIRLVQSQIVLARSQIAKFHFLCSEKQLYFLKFYLFLESFLSILLKVPAHNLPKNYIHHEMGLLCKKIECNLRTLLGQIIKFQGFTSFNRKNVARRWRFSCFLYEKGCNFNQFI